MEFATGCIIDENISKNNYDYSVLKSKITNANLIPDEFILQGYKILNQGSVGSCVAHALAQNRRLAENRQLPQAQRHKISAYYQIKTNDILEIQKSMEKLTEFQKNINLIEN